MDTNIANNIWKTKKIAAYFHNMTGLPKDELESVARMCLMKSARSYDPDKPANFSTWVNRCLHLHLLNFLRDKSRMLKMPRKYTEIYLKTKKILKANPDYTLKKVSEVLDVPLEEIIEVHKCFTSKILDIYFFEEEVLGEESGSIDEDLLSKSLNLAPEEFAPEENDFDISVVTNLTPEELKLLDEVVVRGLCDNTLRRNYKISAKKAIEKANELMDYIYYNA